MFIASRFTLKGVARRTLETRRSHTRHTWRNVHLENKQDSQEYLINKPGHEHKSDSVGVPESPGSFSLKDAIAVLSCFLSLAVVIVVVFHPKVAVYLGQTNQFILVGLCLTLMGWCAGVPLRRLFLISSTNTRASTIQTFDAILRSDPMTARADWRICFLLSLMLSLGPALSVGFKALGGGQSRYQQRGLVGQFGLTDPPRMQDVRLGLSQFFNATLPWFSDPGYDRVYGFNMRVVAENKSAMLDGPISSYVIDLQISLKPMQHKMITATVPAIVNYMRQANLAAAHLTMQAEKLGSNKIIYTDNANIVIGNWNSDANEVFGSHLLQYSLWRESYTGTWRITQSSVELVDAIETEKRLDDHCLLSSNWLAAADLYRNMFHEYDWRYRMSVNGKPKTSITSDSTFLASMIWSRLAALAPDIAPLIQRPRCSSDVLPALRYDIDVIIETVAETITPGWPIIVVLGLYPVFLCASLLYRLLVWPLSPIGEGFGLISLMASVERRSLALLEGAGLSGKLRRPVFVGFGVSKGDEIAKGMATGEICSLLGIEQVKTDRLGKGTRYR